MAERMHQRALPSSSVSADPLPPADGVRPLPWEMVAHQVKTMRFINALRRDGRISWMHKLLYIGPVLILRSPSCYPRASWRPV
jgi:hypothetical protein